MNIYSRKYKGYVIKPSINAPQTYCVVTEGKGGSIPKMLEGNYNSFLKAMSDIDSYLTNGDYTKVKNGKTKIEA